MEASKAPTPPSAKKQRINMEASRTSSPSSSPHPRESELLAKLTSLIHQNGTSTDPNSSSNSSTSPHSSNSSTIPYITTKEDIQTQLMKALKEDLQEYAAQNPSQDVTQHQSIDYKAEHYKAPQLKQMKRLCQTILHPLTASDPR
jgi:hypothetical protein